MKYSLLQYRCRHSSTPFQRLFSLMHSAWSEPIKCIHTKYNAKFQNEWFGASPPRTANTLAVSPPHQLSHNTTINALYISFTSRWHPAGQSSLHYRLWCDIFTNINELRFWYLASTYTRYHAPIYDAHTPNISSATIIFRN
jgi:hypothetical protein